jgi:hypothetical protein
MSLIIPQVIPSLIGYILSCQLLTVLPGLYARSNSRRRSKLTSILLVLSFHLEQQTGFRACDISVVSLTSNFIPSTLIVELIDFIPLKPLDKYVMIIMKNPSSSRLSIEFMMGKTHPCSSMICVITDDILDFRPIQTWLCLVIPYVPRYPCKCFSVPLKIFEPNLLLDTISLLQRSMTVNFWISTRTLGTLAECFLIGYPNSIVRVNIMNFPSPLQLNAFEICCPIMYIMFRLSFGRIYP